MSDDISVKVLQDLDNMDVGDIYKLPDGRFVKRTQIPSCNECVFGLDNNVFSTFCVHLESCTGHTAWQEVKDIKTEQRSRHTYMCNACNRLCVVMNTTMPAACVLHKPAFAWKEKTLEQVIDEIKKIT